MVVLLMVALHLSFLPFPPSLPPPQTYRENTQARHLLKILRLQRQVKQNVNHSPHQGPIDCQVHAMHRQLGGEGGREGGVAEERRRDGPKANEGGEEQGPDAEDVDPFVDRVVVVGGVEGELFDVSGWMGVGVRGEGRRRRMTGTGWVHRGHALRLGKEGATE